MYTGSTRLKKATGNAIAKIAHKIMPKMKALELEKVKKAKEAKTDA